MDDQQDPRMRLRFSKDFAPLHRPLLNSHKLAQLSPRTELHYYRLLMIVDSHGDCPSATDYLYRTMYAERAQGGYDVNLQDVDAWQTELIEHDMILLYPDTEQDVDGEYITLLHILRHWTCGRWDRPIAPRYTQPPGQPKYTRYRKDKGKGQDRAQDEDVDSLAVDEDYKGKRDIKRETDTAASYDSEYPGASHRQPDPALFIAIDQENWTKSPARFVWCYLMSGPDGFDYHPAAAKSAWILREAGATIEEAMFASAESLPDREYEEGAA